MNSGLIGMAAGWIAFAKYSTMSRLLDYTNNILGNVDQRLGLFWQYNQAWSIISTSQLWDKSGRLLEHIVYWSGKVRSSPGSYCNCWIFMRILQPANTVVIQVILPLWSPMHYPNNWTKISSRGNNVHLANTVSHIGMFTSYFILQG